MAVYRRSAHVRSHTAVLRRHGRHRFIRRDARQVRARRDHAGRMAEVPSAARHLQSAAGCRLPDAAHQDPPGDPRRGAARSAGGRQRAPFARVRPHLHAPERAAALRAAARHGAGDAAARRGRHDHARGVRQLRPEHHGVPVRGRRARRSVRRHAVRRSDDSIPAAASAQLVAAAQIQDRVRRAARPRITPSRRSTTSGGAPRSRRTVRAAADSGRGRGGHGHHVPVRRVAVRVPPGVRHPHGGRGRHPRVPPSWRLRAQAAEPAEVPAEDDGLGQVVCRVRAGAGGRSSLRRARSCRSIPRILPSKGRP